MASIFGGLTVGQRIIGGFLAVLFLSMAIMSYSAYSSLTTLNQQIIFLHDNMMVPYGVVSEAQNQFNEIRANSRTIFLEDSGNVAEINNRIQLTRDAEANFEKQLALYSSNYLLDKDSSSSSLLKKLGKYDDLIARQNKDISLINSEYPIIKQAIETSFALHKEGKDAESIAYYMKEVSPNTRKVTDALYDLGTIENEQSTYAVNNAEAETSSAVNMLMITALGTLIVGGALAFWLANSITRVLADAATQLSSAAQQLYSSADSVSTTTQQVASTIQQIAKGASHQSQLSEQGNIASKRAAESMDSIKVQTSQSVGSVRELGDQTKQIAEITEIIKHIAEQTNMLALNAAIEAARAGEQGRGFAVVANEVRELAEQSAKASNNISGLVAEIQGKSAEVVKQIEAGSDKLENSTAVVQEALGSLEEIASVAEETAAGAEEVAATSEEQSAAMEEVTASAEQLASLSQSLQALIGVKVASSHHATMTGIEAHSERLRQVQDKLRAAREHSHEVVEEIREDEEKEEKPASQQKKQDDEEGEGKGKGDADSAPWVKGGKTRKGR